MARPENESSKSKSKSSSDSGSESPEDGYWGRGAEDRPDPAETFNGRDR
jgi:hypothetical protein